MSYLTAALEHSRPSVECLGDDARTPRTSAAAAVAVDASEDVFVSYYSQGGGLFEYKRFASCTPEQLSAMGSAKTFDLAPDANKNLIANGCPNSIGA